jgi:argininosuccinate lyase
MCGLQITTKGIPSTYNRDLHEIVKPVNKFYAYGPPNAEFLFRETFFINEEAADDSILQMLGHVKPVSDCIQIAAGVLSTLTINPKSMEA